MAKKRKNVTFKSVKEYREFYAHDAVKQHSKGSKYYRIGEDIARMVCEKAVNNLHPNHAVRAC